MKADTIKPAIDYRIGNLVLDEDSELCQIEQLSSPKMDMAQQVSNIENKFCISKKYPSNIYAIPLTEEWLLKCGFAVGSKRWLFSGYGIKINLGCFMVILQGKAITVKYVHTLQNLIFALTGNELTIKL